MKTQEVVLRVIREDDAGAMTDAKNITDDTCSLASNSQKENPNVIFTSEKLEISDELVDVVNNMTIKNVGYELHTATVSDAQVNLVSDPDIVTLTSNRIIDQKLLSCRTIREVSILTPPTS